LAAQVVSAIIVIIWVVCCSLILFGTLKALGIFRVPAEYEVAGLDVSKHGGSAYLGDPNHQGAEQVVPVSQKVLPPGRSSA
jgi:ammonia channel protein AmtB